MILTYFDESKPTTGQPYYWYCGLAVRDEMLGELQTEADALAKQCFPSAQPLSKESEFHATDIASGNGNFRGWSLDDRFEVLQRLANIIDKPDGVFRIMSQGDTREILAADVARDGFMYFVERASQLARQHSSPALLIGDFEREKTVNQFTRDLCGYRENGTPYAYGQDVDNVVDTVHFAHSYRSRLLQLADFLTWTRQLLGRTDAQNFHREAFIRFLREETDIHWDHKRKRWPGSNM